MEASRPFGSHGLGSRDAVGPPINVHLRRCSTNSPAPSLGTFVTIRFATQAKPSVRRPGTFGTPLRVPQDSGGAAAAQRDANVLPIIREIEAAPGSQNWAGIAAALNERKVATARGRAWSHVQVGMILDRATT
jgi:hypothetical protein